MGRRKGLLKGAKTNRNHHTTIKEAVNAIKVAKECPHVTKISLGLIKPITPLRGAAPHLKFIEMSGGLRMQVRGQESVQFIWLYTTAPAETITFINERWEP
jgi:hypothetical protein